MVEELSIQSLKTFTEQNEYLQNLCQQLIAQVGVPSPSKALSEHIDFDVLCGQLQSVGLGTLVKLEDAIKENGNLTLHFTVLFVKGGSYLAPELADDTSGIAVSPMADILHCLCLVSIAPKGQQVVLGFINDHSLGAFSRMSSIEEQKTAFANKILKAYNKALDLVKS